MGISFGCIRADKLRKHCLSFDLQLSGDPGLPVITHRNGTEALVAVPVSYCCTDIPCRTD